MPALPTLDAAKVLFDYSTKYYFCLKLKPCLKRAGFHNRKQTICAGQSAYKRDVRDSLRIRGILFNNRQNGVSDKMADRENLILPI